MSKRLNSRVRQILATPVASLFALIVLGASAAALPEWSPYNDSSAARLRDKLADEVLGRARGNWCRQSPIFIAERTASGIALHSPDVDSGWDAIGETLAVRPHDLMQVTFVSGSSRSGLWAITTKEWYAGLRETPFGRGPPFSAEERQQALKAVSDELYRQGTVDAKLAASLPLGGMRERDILWGGWLHDAVALAALIGFVYSLRWVPVTVRRWREARAARLVSESKCPSCGYSRVGLSCAVCPECGVKFHAGG
jgi:hypothetical protein